jgi:two-component system, LytTR family, response regulator
MTAFPALRAVIVDDEPLARSRLAALLAEDGRVELVGQAGDGRSAVPLIHDKRPDVVFLDVQMPVLDGFDVLDLLAEPRPQVVFVTAYDEYALRAFEVHALDYLTKPVRRQRLALAIERVAEQMAFKRPSPGFEALRRERKSEPLQRLTLRAGRRLRVVEIGEIRYVEAEEKLVFAHLAEGRRATDFTLKELEKRLDPTRFARIHRAFIVNVAVVRELVPAVAGTYQLVLDDGSRLPVSRRRLRTVKALLGA